MATPSTPTFTAKINYAPLYQRRERTKEREGERASLRKESEKIVLLSNANGSLHHYHGSLKWRWPEMTSKKKQQQLK